MTLARAGGQGRSADSRVPRGSGGFSAGGKAAATGRFNLAARSRGRSGPFSARPRLKGLSCAAGRPQAMSPFDRLRAGLKAVSKPGLGGAPYGRASWREIRAFQTQTRAKELDSFSS